MSELKDGSGTQSEPPESEVKGPSLPEVMWQHRWCVIGMVFLCSVGALAYLYQATPIYRSTARLYIEKEGPKIMSENEGMIMSQARWLFNLLSRVN